MTYISSHIQIMLCTHWWWLSGTGTISLRNWWFVIPTLGIGQYRTIRILDTRDSSIPDAICCHTIPTHSRSPSRPSTYLPMGTKIIHSHLRTSDSSHKGKNTHLSIIRTIWIKIDGPSCTWCYVSRSSCCSESTATILSINDISIHR